MKKKENNIAFIDAQNLHLGTNTEKWKIDFKRFRVYLKDKFKIEEAYFFLGFINDDYQEMYRKIQKAGFILEFRDHNSNMLGKKKRNVDVDIVFEIMKRIQEEKDFDKIVLVSGDGDYIKLVKYLIEKKLFKKIQGELIGKIKRRYPGVLFPNKRYSSLYKKIQNQFGMNLSQDRVKNILKFRE